MATAPDFSEATKGALAAVLQRYGHALQEPGRDVSKQHHRQYVQFQGGAFLPDGGTQGACGSSGQILKSVSARLGNTAPIRFEEIKDCHEIHRNHHSANDRH